MKKYFRVLTIAGSDSGGGAGIQADLKTFSALGVYGSSVITAVTAQNTGAVSDVFAVSPGSIAKQIDAVLSDIGADAVKIGMLHDADIIGVVAERLSFYKIKNVVLDPVMISKSGKSLLQTDAVQSMQHLLFPLVSLLTPNIPEAEILSKRALQNKADVEKAAQVLLHQGLPAILIKGGHLMSDVCSDYLALPGASLWFENPRIVSPNTHGTGCTFSAAIAAFLARGLPLSQAVQNAELYLNQALQAGAEFQVGQGHGPVCHFYQTLSHIDSKL